jgi:hypothetical protein
VYAKLQVSSRAEAILKLGKSTGLITAGLRESIVEKERETDHTGGRLISKRRSSGSLVNNVSILRKGIAMKSRWRHYFLVGLIFGAIYWHCFGVTARFLSSIFIHVNVEENALATWVILSISFLIYFGVWLFPIIVPAIYEFRHSGTIFLSVCAVISVWSSAVLGYYINYVVLLALIGLPNMEYYLVFGQRGPTFWQDWAELFPRLILFKFLKWTVIGIVVSGFAGLLTSWLYSVWRKKDNTALPA